MPSKLAAWVRQPTTIDGLGTVACAAVGVAVQALTHSTELAIACGVLARALVSLAIPDNSAAAKPLEKLVADTVQAAVEKRIAASMPVLTADALAAVVALAPAVSPAPAPAAPAPAVPAQPAAPAA